MIIQTQSCFFFQSSNINKSIRLMKLTNVFQPIQNLKLYNQVIIWNLFIKNMTIINNIKEIWSPVLLRTYNMSFSKMTKKLSVSVWTSLMFIFTFFYYAVSKPEKLTLKMSKTAEKVSDMKIPRFMRKSFFKLYAKYYKVKLHEIVDPIQSFTTFSDFFTRRVFPRYINHNPKMLVSPADSKILKISEINHDQCSIIKGASYSLGQILTGVQRKFNKDQVQSLKSKPSNKLYQVIFYLAPGDYHRFHSPTNFFVTLRKSIGGILLSVNQKTLMKKKRVYQRNGRVVVSGTWSPYEEKNRVLNMNMVMVGALNVGRIKVCENQAFEKGQQLGYFNLGSTIVMIFEAEDIKTWHKKEGDLIRYGDILCQVI